jgi:hypothetical protein
LRRALAAAALRLRSAAETRFFQSVLMTQVCVSGLPSGFPHFEQATDSRGPVLALRRDPPEHRCPRSGLYWRPQERQAMSETLIRTPADPPVRWDAP